MELRVLKYFLTIVRMESITRAAEALHLTQPTLSRQLKELEEEIGVTLLHRGSKKITLTPEGLLFKRRAEEILELVEKTRQELPLQQKEVEGTVSIGIGEVAAMETLATLCGSFRREHPRVRFEIYTATADVVRERMERGLIDLGVLLLPVEIEKYAYLQISEPERIVLLMRPDDPLTRKVSVSPKDLLDLPLILPTRLNVQGELAHWFGDSFERLQIAFWSNLGTNAAYLVRSGSAYALVAEGAIRYWDPRYLTSRPLNPALSLSSILAWPREKSLSLATERFIAYVKCSKGMTVA